MLSRTPHLTFLALPRRRGLARPHPHPNPHARVAWPDPTPNPNQEWLGLTDSLQHIANVALMEHRLPRDSEDSTLWEGEELTVRYMLEEGKLNLCLRLMEEYKSGQAQEQPQPPP